MDLQGFRHFLRWFYPDVIGLGSLFPGVYESFARAGCRHVF
ncbi:hypothetical protein PTH_0590 [Pelotomaculum thermopropionicum SI]|uniref:Uncharacterized protein n=1 Tax=Pelotomaculum thermopropionicum (strain DSM 13744 / JCM 10971 / SI) TaxID=370438 RepID=A5D4R2_PELTS|nr:hypothetical protein PTH_0590 [Pelotomaculum thermopropionicum SI]